MDTSKLNGSVTSINKMGFNQVWSGSYYTAQRDSLNNAMESLNKCIEDINLFNRALEKLERYIKICERIQELYNSISSCSSSHTKEQNEQGCGTCGGYANEISQKEAERKALREEIIALLGKFKGIKIEIAEPIDFNPTDVEEPEDPEIPDNIPSYEPIDWDGPVLTGPMGFNRGPEATETWYDLDMAGVVSNMEKLYGYTDLVYSVREDGVKLLSGTDPNGNKFENLVIVAADVIHPGHPNGAYERGAIVDTSLGKGIVADHCGRSEEEYAESGHIHFDIATSWEHEPYHSQQYG